MPSRFSSTYLSPTSFLLSPFLFPHILIVFIKFSSFSGVLSNYPLHLSFNRDFPDAVSRGFSFSNPLLAPSCCLSNPIKQYPVHWIDSKGLISTSTRFFHAIYALCSKLNGVYLLCVFHRMDFKEEVQLLYGWMAQVRGFIFYMHFGDRHLLFSLSPLFA